MVVEKSSCTSPAKCVASVHSHPRMRASEDADASQPMCERMTNLDLGLGDIERQVAEDDLAACVLPLRPGMTTGGLLRFEAAITAAF